MNDKNYQDITQTVLPKVGFPPGILDEQILSAMKGNAQSFVVKAVDTIGSDQIAYDVKFARSETKKDDPNFYLNSVAATMTKADGEVRKHEFQYYYTRGYNVEQINNLMDGRSVFSQFPGKIEGETHKMWYSLDLNNKDDKGMNLPVKSFEATTGFNLVIEAGKVPVVNQSTEEKNRMLHDLRNGTEYIANIKKPDGSIEKGAVVALPHVNQVAAYNMQGERIVFQKSTMQAVPLNAGKDKAVSATTAAIVNNKETTGQGTGRKNSATG